MMGWQWHQLDHMQIVCTLLQTDNHASTSPFSFFTGGIPFLLRNQQCQSTESWKMAIEVEVVMVEVVMVSVTEMSAYLLSVM